MVTVSMAIDEFGGLVCTLADGKTSGIVRAASGDEAARGLLDALDSVASRGAGECYWLRESGDYRWVMRRTGDTCRLVVLWSAGTLTGWENIFWADCEWQPLEQAIRQQIHQYERARTAV